MHTSRILSAAVAGVVLFSAHDAQAQLGGLRRAAQRAAAATGAPAAAPAASAQPAPASSVVGSGEVLEMTPAVLDRFARALAAEHGDRAQQAQVLAQVKTPEQYSQCMMNWMMSPAGQAATQRMTAAAEGGNQAYLNAATEMKATMTRVCGVDPSERSNLQSAAQGHSVQAAAQAGEFTPLQYAFLKERVAPFCHAAATSAAGDVRLPGSGSNVYWVYTAAEAAALRERCGALMAAMNVNS